MAILHHVDQHVLVCVLTHARIRAMDVLDALISVLDAAHVHQDAVRLVHLVAVVLDSVQDAVNLAMGALEHALMDVLRHAKVDAVLYVRADVLIIALAGVRHPMTLDRSHVRTHVQERVMVVLVALMD